MNPEATDRSQLTEVEQELFDAVERVADITRFLEDFIARRSDLETPVDRA
ncbi:MAG: hypothetical protein AAF081_08550 [Actinomycetota bacterium]